MTPSIARRASQDGAAQARPTNLNPQQTDREQESKKPPLSDDAQQCLAIVAQNLANQENRPYPPPTLPLTESEDIRRTGTSLGTLHQDALHHVLGFLDYSDQLVLARTNRNARDCEATGPYHADRTARFARLIQRITDFEALVDRSRELNRAKIEEASDPQNPGPAHRAHNEALLAQNNYLKDNEGDWQSAVADLITQGFCKTSGRHLRTYNETIALLEAGEIDSISKKDVSALVDYCFQKNSMHHGNAHFAFRDISTPANRQIAIHSLKHARFHILRRAFAVLESRHRLSTAQPDFQP